jgi:hypothetical protein
MEVTDVIAPFMPYFLGLAVCSALVKAGGRLAALIGGLGAVLICYLLVHR